MSYSFGPSNSNLRAWVKERFVPLVMVVASDAVENLCREKNGLSFVDILRPFGEQQGLEASLRISGQSFRLSETRLRFSYAHTMEQPTAEVIDAHLKDVVSAVAEAELPKAAQQLTDGTVETTPWFLKYRQDFLRLLCFDSHETYDHPLGCIYAISSAEVDSMRAFEDLAENAMLPSLMLQEYMSPMRREECGTLFVIVHDGSREGQTGLELARERVRIVQKEVGHEQCALLLLNTSGGKAEMRGTPPVEFGKLRSVAVRGGGGGEHGMSDPEPAEGWGSLLSKADLERVNETVQTYLLRCFLPKLEIKIARLRSSPSFKRRSFAGKFVERTSSFLKSGLGTLGREVTISVGFKYDTDAAQMRQLGDIFFLLGRYDDALEIFQSVSVSREAHPKFYAGVQFMLGLTSAVLVQKGDPSVYFAKSYGYYLRNPGKTAQMYATRTAMIQSVHCLNQGQVAAAAQALLRSHDTEEMLRGALLLEEAAGLLLRLQPPCRRKFAFQMTLAGVRFYNSLLPNLSLRCYNLILDIYTNKQWLMIEQHVASMMLMFHREQGNNADAFGWTIDMLTAQHALPPALQKEYIEWICQYIREAPSQSVSSIADFNLPVLHLETMQVRFDGEIVAGTELVDQVEPTLWTELERRFRDPFSASTTTGLALGNGFLDEPYQWVVCGETLTFSCVFENPVQTPIEVTSAQLLFEFERTDESSCPTASPVSVPEQRFNLKESESATVQLKLVPTTPGRLRIIGVSWYLNGLIPGHKLFGQSSRKGEDRLPFRAQSQYPALLFVAQDPVPRLVLESAPTPSELWRGEVWHQTWRLRSVGKVHVQSLQITCSSPDLTVVASREREAFVKNDVFDIEVVEAEELQLNLCLNPQRTGETLLHTVLRYEAPQSETPLRVRFLRHSFRVSVHEALRVQSCLLPSEVRRSFVLAMELQNCNDEGEIDVTAMQSASQAYGIQCIGAGSAEFQVRIFPGQKLMQHVLVTRLANPSDSGRQVTPRRDGSHLSFSLHYTSPLRSEEDGQSRNGRLELTHDVTALSTRVDICVASSQPTGRLENGVAVFSVPVRVQNISSEPLSVSFKAGEEWLWEEQRGWKQDVRVDKDKEHVQEAGLSPVPSWTWSSQTECTISCLRPSESVLLHPEILCFFAGRFCIADYCCRWKSIQNPLLSEIVPGKPLYLTVRDAASEPSV